MISVLEYGRRTDPETGRLDSHVYHLLRENDGMTAPELSDELMIPSPEVRHALHRLNDQGLVYAEYESGELGIVKQYDRSRLKTIIVDDRHPLQAVTIIHGLKITGELTHL